MKYRAASRTIPVNSVNESLAEEGEQTEKEEESGPGYTWKVSDKICRNLQILKKKYATRETVFTNESQVFSILIIASCARHRGLFV